MIDIESYVYSKVVDAITAASITADISGVYVESPEAFPHISIEETSNVNRLDCMGIAASEIKADLLYTINIYTNTATKKADAKRIASVVDTAMLGMGFRRSFSGNLPNLERTIYRLTLHYVGTVAVAPDGVSGHYTIQPRA